MSFSDAPGPLLSVHVPKAAGTSFLSALHDAFGPENVLKEYADDPVDPSSPIWAYPDWFRRNRPRTLGGFKVVHGHFSIQKFDLIPSAIRVVMLREPVENLVSIYCFWKTSFETPMRSHALYELAKRERLSLLELAEIPRLRRLMSETFLGGFDMTRFDVIGAHERRTEFISAVSAAVGIPLAASHRENVTAALAERDDLMSDGKLMAQLRFLLQDDIRFYETYARC
nr:hypothetical protein [uncultured Rhodopila sp.]